MANDVRNLPIEQAQAQLREQLQPRDERGASDVPAERYAEARSELERLAAKAK